MVFGTRKVQALMFDTSEEQQLLLYFRHNGQSHECSTSPPSKISTSGSPWISHLLWRRRSCGATLWSPLKLQEFISVHWNWCWSWLQWQLIRTYYRHCLHIINYSYLWRYEKEEDETNGEHEQEDYHPSPQKEQGPSPAALEGALKYLGRYPTASQQTIRKQYSMEKSQLMR